MSTLKIKLVESLLEIEGIKKLQEKNLRTTISEEEALSQGFLTASYSMAYLQEMNQAAPTVIAVDGSEVVGYAMVATQSIRSGHDLIEDLFNTIDRTKYNNELLKNSNYVVVGQLCVAKSHRGMGLVQKLYGHFRDCYAQEFQYLVTDVAQANTRSLKAHRNTGFEVIDTLTYGGIKWDIVLWDWRKSLVQ